MYRPDRRRGISLLEILIAVCMLGVAVNLLYVEHIGIARDLRAQEDRLRAYLLAQEWLEVSSAQLPALGPSLWRQVMPRRYGMDCVMEVRPHAKYPYMREVLVTVTFGGGTGGPPHAVYLSRLVPDRVGPGS